MNGVVLNEPPFELYQEEKKEVEYLREEQFVLNI
jgi:hypothetical protein